MPPVLSFSSVSRPDALVCILGSMPGRASLEMAQYYAHPRNAFWAIMEELLGIPRSLPYADRLEYLKVRRVALWDVLGSCIRKGSLDSDIEKQSIVPNDFTSFFASHTMIGTIFFNGGKAETVYRKDVLPALPERYKGFRLIRLPSTSPANAGKSFEQKRELWRSVEWALDENASQGYYHDRQLFRSDLESRSPQYARCPAE